MTDLETKVLEMYEKSMTEKKQKNVIE